MIGIYKITNPKGKIYIGQSINIKYREARYKNGYCKNQVKIYNSIKKYGWDNHVFEILCECSSDNLNEKELYYSNLYNSTCLNSGLNIRQCGGSKGKLSEETKNKISLANKGRKHTEEAKLKIRYKRKLQVFTQETRDKLKGRKVWNKGIPLANKQKTILSKLYSGKTGKLAYASKPIIQYDLNGNNIKSWDNARHVQRELNYSFSNINRCCRGERLTAYSSVWKYAE